MQQGVYEQGEAQTVQQPSPPQMDTFDVPAVGPGGVLTGGIVAAVFILNKLWTMMRSDRLEITTNERTSAANAQLLASLQEEIGRLSARVAAQDLLIEELRGQRTNQLIELSMCQRDLQECKEDLDVYKASING